MRNKQQKKIKKLKTKTGGGKDYFFQQKKTYSGENFILDLHNGDLLSNFTRMSSSGFEF
jgi:hypothetical protein